jgi:hypothetical protein
VAFFPSFSVAVSFPTTAAAEQVASGFEFMGPGKISGAGARARDTQPGAARQQKREREGKARKVVERFFEW